MSIQSIDRAFDIIEYLGSHPNGGNLSEIAQDLKLPLSTVYRITRDLVQSGYLRKNLQTNTYSIGLKFVELSRPNIKNLELRTEAHPHLNILSHQLESKVYLATVSDEQICYVDSVIPTQNSSPHSLIGQKRPLFSTGLGKALMMMKSDEEILKLVDRQGLVAYTPYTIVEPEDLIHEIGIYRERGWSEDNQEDNLNCCCIAVPVRNSIGRTVAAISASWSLARFSAIDKEKTAASVIATAEEIASMLSPVF